MKLISTNILLFYKWSNLPWKTIGLDSNFFQSATSWKSVRTIVLEEGCSHSRPLLISSLASSGRLGRWAACPQVTLRALLEWWWRQSEMLVSGRYLSRLCSDHVYPLPIQQDFCGSTSSRHGVQRTFCTFSGLRNINQIYLIHTSAAT